VCTRNQLEVAGFGLPKQHSSNVLQGVMSKMRTKFALDNTCDGGWVSGIGVVGLTALNPPYT